MNIESTKNLKIYTMLPYLGIVLVTFITSLVLVSNPFSELLPKHDSSMFTYFGYAMGHGRTIYTEIFDHKGPIIFIFNYIGNLLSTSTFTGIYVLEFLSLFFFFIFTYWLSKMWLTKFPALIPLIIEAIVLIFFIEGGNLTEEYALPFISYSLYVFSKFYKDKENINWYEIILLGGSFTIVFLLRANMISLWAAFCFIILVEFLMYKNFKELIRVLILFVVGILLVLIPIVLYLYLNKALSAGIFQAFTFNFMYLDSSQEKSEAIRSLYSILSNHYVTAFFVAYLILVMYKWKKYSAKEKFFSVAIILFTVVSFYTSVMSGREYKHYLMAMIPTMSIPLIFIFKELSKNLSNNKLLLSFLLLSVILYNNQLKTFYETIYTTNVDVREVELDEELESKDSFVLKNAEKNKNEMTVAAIIKENSNEEDKIYVHRDSGLLYLLSDRLSSIKYFNLPAIDLNENDLIGKDFFKDITNADTELIVLQKGFNNSDKVGTELMFFEYVTENYTSIHDGNGYFIYKKN